MSNNKIFNSIKNFVSSLNECYGDDHDGLRLYNDLLQKSTNEHTEFIAKTNDVFRMFCLDNEICILNKNYNLSVSQIKFSEKMYIDISKILEECDNSEKDVIWKHIALIYSYFKPSTHLKEMLTQNKSNNSNESNFIKDMINKVEDTLDGGSINNPMEAITKMMTTGVFSDLVGNMTNGLQSGDLNLGTLLGSVNEMVDTMNVDGGNKGESSSSSSSMSQSNIEEVPKRTNRNRKKKKIRRK